MSVGLGSVRGRKFILFLKTRECVWLLLLLLYCETWYILRVKTCAKLRCTSWIHYDNCTLKHRCDVIWKILYNACHMTYKFRTQKSLLIVILKNIQEPSKTQFLPCIIWRCNAVGSVWRIINILCDICVFVKFSVCFCGRHWLPLVILQLFNVTCLKRPANFTAGYNYK
jgi:hypothetical protein